MTNYVRVHIVSDQTIKTGFSQWWALCRRRRPTPYGQAGAEAEVCYSMEDLLRKA